MQPKEISNTNYQGYCVKKPKAINDA